MIHADPNAVASDRTRFPAKVGWLASCTLLVAIGAVTALVVRSNDGHLIYFADDPYIHMAIAKNLARHGVWGVTPYGFSSGSSSPLWTALLALAYLVGGVNEIAPLILNTLFGLLTVLLASHVSRSVGGGRASEVVVLAGVSLPVLFYTFYGMEPTLQFLLTVAFVHVAASALSHPGERIPVERLALLAGLATATRYEALALVGVVSVLFLIRREWRVALLVTLAALSPPAIVGLTGIAHGWHFLPTAVLFKSRLAYLTLGSLIRGEDPGYTGLSLPLAFLVAMAGAVLLSSIRRGRTRSAQTWWLAIFVLTSLAYAFVARLSPQPLRRYEAHLLVLGLIAVPGPSFELLSWLREKARIGPLLAKFAAVALALSGLGLFAAVGHVIVDRVVTGSGYIYQQQFQMARVVMKSFPGGTIALNDIGAVNFYSEPRLLDLAGLATKEVTDAMLAGSYDTDKIRSLAHDYNVDLVMVYREWFVGRAALPPEWKCLMTWRISKRLTGIGGDVVSFIVPNEEMARSTMEKLQKFSPELPRTVAVAECEG